MTYRIAGIDVHKRMLAVVIADVSVEGEYQFERRKVGTSPSEMCRLAEWLVAEQVEEVVMESPRNIGDQYGRRWSNSGGPNGFRMAEPGRASCIWRRRSRIEERRDGRRISQMPND